MGWQSCNVNVRAVSSVGSQYGDGSRKRRVPAHRSQEDDGAAQGFTPGINRGRAGARAARSRRNLPPEPP